MHTGDLYKDSPGLSLLLKGALTPQEQAKLVTLYELACQHGALNEGAITRLEGANFNPRPARIIQILLTDGANSDCTTLAGSLVSCAESTLFEAHPELADQFYKSYLAIHSALSGDQSKSLVSTEKAIVFSHLLDEVRHLHMRHLSPTSLLKKVSQLRAIYQLIHPLPEYARLNKVVDAAMERASRLVEQHE